ncbi:hypothetical protein EGO53_03125 [Serratia liquefaciens]|uniref:Uncharacterized protein n=1 Tax=Serratia liquefaciens TaxID=614 RepID=A0A515CRP6_SERLI|nr:hypothetical protein EGO53_03125 [Serratia liquefaciens]
MKINQENQFIDFRLITQRGKNHAFIPFVNNLTGSHWLPVFLTTSVRSTRPALQSLPLPCGTG